MRNVLLHWRSRVMLRRKQNCFINALFTVLIISGLALSVNHLTYQYLGNNYFPSSALLFATTLPLMYAGFYLQYGVNSKITRMTQEILCFFMVMAVMILATNAVQYTPFTPIDKQLIAWDSFLPFDVKSLMDWTYAHPLIKTYFETIYQSLTYQMTYLPLLFIILGRTTLVREYYCLLLITALLGFCFYYFFPTTAPASIIESPHFSDSQHATGLKFNQIHQHIKPTTYEGGMISFPSFHIIWAWLCVYLLRHWPVAFVLMLLMNLSLSLSCVMLGWHYPIDALGSIIVIIMGHSLYAVCRKHHLSERTLSKSLSTAANRQPAKARRSSTT